MRSNKGKPSPESPSHNRENGTKHGKRGLLSAATSRTPSDDRASLGTNQAKASSSARKKPSTKPDAEGNDIGSPIASSLANDCTKRKPEIDAKETGPVKPGLETEREQRFRTSSQQPGGQEHPRKTGDDVAKAPSQADIVSQPEVHDSTESSFTTASSNAEDGEKVSSKKESEKKETSVIPPLLLSALTDSKQSTKPEDEAKGEVQRATDRRHSTTTTKRDDRILTLKKRRKKREALGKNKAVQTISPEPNAATAAGPPIHVLLSPSSCGLCESNNRMLHGCQFSRPAAVDTIRASISNQKSSRGVIKKTVTTTRRTERGGGRNSPDDDEDNKTEVLEIVDGTDAPLPREKVPSADGKPSVASSSMPAKTVGDGVKKTVTTTRRKKGADKYERNSDSADVIEETVTEVIGLAGDEDEHHPNDDSKTGATAFSLSPKGNATAGALKKAVKTTRPAKNRGRCDDSYETVTTEIVELCDDTILGEQSGRSAPLPTITGALRDASTTQYYYAESRRPASAPGQAPRWAGPWNPRMRFRPPGHWANPIYTRSLAPECPVHQHGGAQHIPGCRFAAVLQTMPVPGAECGILSGCRAHSPAHSQTCFERRLGPFFGGQIVPTQISVPASPSPCCGLPNLPCALHEDSQTWSPPCNCCAAFPSAATTGYPGVPQEQDDVSEGTYDVLYYAEPPECATEYAGRFPSGAADLPTPAQNQFAYYGRNRLAAASSPSSVFVTHRRRSGIDDGAGGLGQVHLDARAAGATTDVSLSGRRQVTQQSPEGAVPFLFFILAEVEVTVAVYAARQHCPTLEMF